MTNGEKFQQIFAVSQVDECDLNVYAWLPCHDAIEIPLEWWNTNYSEIPTGSTTKNDLGKAEQETDYTWEDVSSVMDAMEHRTNSLIENIKSEIIHFANAHCSGDDINIYDVIKVIDDCCEDENLTTKNDLGVTSELEKNSKKLEKEQEPRWIPVSERLPEEHICDDGFHEPSKSVLVQMKSGAMHTARYWSRYDERWLDLNYPTTDEVIAWMPLPTSYKRGEET